MAQRDKTLQETITFDDKRKSLIIIQIKEALWRKSNKLKPLFGCNAELSVSKEVKENVLASENRNNNCRKKINMHVTIIQYEITFVQSKLNPPEHNLPAREKKSLEQQHFGMR